MNRMTITPAGSPDPSFQTASGGSSGKASICFALDGLHPAGERNKFGVHALTGLANIFYENGYDVTYGRPRTEEEFWNESHSRGQKLRRNSATRSNCLLIALEPTTDEAISFGEAEEHE